MSHDRPLLRIWIDLTGLIVPLVAMAGHVLGWSEVLTTALTAICVIGVLGTWLGTTDMARWRAERRARVGRWRRRLGGASR